MYSGITKWCRSPPQSISTYVKLIFFYFAAPTPVTIEPAITKAILHNVKRSYHRRVGLGSSAALLADEKKKTFVKYTFDGNNIFEKAFPHGMTADCRKCFLDDGRIVLRAMDGNDPTRTYNGNLELMQVYAGQYGDLIGSLAPDLLAYSKVTSSSHEYEVHIYSADKKHQRVLILRPGEGRKWSRFLSVCRHPQAGYVAVVDYDNKRLEIYSNEGMKVYRQRSKCHPV